jgi:hypothetical protein
VIAASVNQLTDAVLFWRTNMSIATAQSIRRARRFQDRRREKAAHVITAMQRGASLNLTFTKRGSVWSLSGGTVIAPEIALAVVSDVRVCSVNDGLFPQTPQTWRYVES